MSDNASGDICAASGLTSVVKDPGVDVAMALDEEYDCFPTSTGS